MNSSKTKFEAKVDLQCRRLTGHGRSAVAVIEILGADSAEVVLGCCSLAGVRPLRVGQVRYGSWHGGNGSAAESVVITEVTEQSVEVHCHGGPAAIDRIISDLKRFGVALQDDDLSRSDAETLLHREAQQMLARCVTARTAAVALDQVRGAMADWARSVFDGTVLDLQRIQSEAEEIFARAAIGTRLDRPFAVVLAGRPNVGKSSLVNAIMGYQRSIVFDQAGTTRDVLHADTVIDGLPIRLSDTAGIRDTTDLGDSNAAIEREGIRRAVVAMEQADLIVWVADRDDIEFENDDVQAVYHSAKQSGQLIDVRNKVDLIDKPTAGGNVISTAATTGDGVPCLIEMIATKLVDSFPLTRSAVPVNQRQVRLLRQLAESRSIDDARAMMTALLHG